MASACFNLLDGMGVSQLLVPMICFRAGNLQWHAATDRDGMQGWGSKALFRDWH